jgi:hypothetical protein
LTRIRASRFYDFRTETASNDLYVDLQIAQGGPFLNPSFTIKLPITPRLLRFARNDGAIAIRRR